MFIARNGVFLEKEFLEGEKSGRTVQLEEIRDESIGQDSTSDTNVAEQVEMPMAIEASLLDNDEPATCRGDGRP